MQLLNDKVDGSGGPENILPAAEWNQLPTELQNIITALGMTLSNGDLNQLGKALAGYVANGAFYTDSGIADAYVLNTVGGKQSLPEYTDGAEVEFIATNPNTGAATVNVTGNGVKNIKINGGIDPSAGDINGRTILKFDGANDWFELELTDTLSWVGWLLENAFYTDVSNSVSSEDTLPTGIFFRPDGSKMYVIGSTNDSVFQYTLATAWDLSTASYDSVNFSVNAEDTTPKDIFFKPDGTKMYMIGDSSNSIYQYTLSTAWDLSTASYDSVSFSVAAEDNSPLGIFFKPDGSKMYVSAGFLAGDVYQYTLSTAWDLSTASYDSVSHDVSSQSNSPTGIFFKPDGAKMYMIGSTTDSVYQYTLSTAWDLSTASYDSVNFSVTTEDTSPEGIFFKPDGAKMYMVGSVSDTIFQYSTARPYQDS